MCGRTCLTLSKSSLCSACSYKAARTDKLLEPEWRDEHNLGKEYKPSKNIAPTEVTPVLVSSYNFGNIEHDEYILKPMMWGMVPPWHKGDHRTHGLSTNNCRLENIHNSKLYNAALSLGNRCIILAEGFYEWQTTDKTAKVKQPYYIYPKQVKSSDESNDMGSTKLLKMAGLFNVWQSENEEPLYSYSVITMESDATLSWLHHRMPAILENDLQIESWLNTKEVPGERALSILKQSKDLDWYPVSTLVNNSRNNSDECNRRIELKKSVQSSMMKNWLIRKKPGVSEDSQIVKKAKLD